MFKFFKSLFTDKFTGRYADLKRKMTVRLGEPFVCPELGFSGKDSGHIVKNIREIFWITLADGSIVDIKSDKVDEFTFTPKK